MREAALLGVASLLLLVLTGCNDQNGSKPPGPTPDPKVITDAGSIPEKPQIDVTIQKMDMPVQVNRGQEFDVTLELKNTQQGGTPPALAANVTIRASSTTGPNIQIGETQFRDLQPQKTRRRTFKVKAPHMPGLWTVKAVIEPFGYTDESNNEITKLLPVN